jgi:RNA polymerase sigma-70 factor, ECF subfamily
VSERLLGFFVRRAPDPQTAVDLWAETWAVAYQRRRSFRGSEGDQDEAWLFGIAYRQLARYRRSGEIERRALRRLGLDRVVDELSYDEPARRLGISQANARAREPRAA